MWGGLLSTGGLSKKYGPKGCLFHACDIKNEKVGENSKLGRGS